MCRLGAKGIYLTDGTKLDDVELVARLTYSQRYGNILPLQVAMSRKVGRSWSREAGYQLDGFLFVRPHLSRSTGVLHDAAG